MASECVVFILPHKFQRKRLDDMKKSMTKKRLNYEESLSANVTHIVTEFESCEQVDRQAAKEGLHIPDSVCIVSTKWLIESLKASKFVTVQDSHMLKKTMKPPLMSETAENKNTPELPEWACQRGAKLHHFNNKLTDALEVLQEHAELRDISQDYSRALAFRRASCVLKALPFTLKHPSQLDGLKDIGGHVKRVVTDILDNGRSSEVEDILSSSWFQKMRLFTSVFGVGPSTAKNWIERGWETMEDVKQAGSPSGDWRVTWGLAFHEDLTHPVSRQEADHFVSVVEEEANKVLPGAVVTLCGGFRRGKPSGHDVDILLSHPREGKEVTLLPKLLSALENKGYILTGLREKNSYRSEILYEDFKLSMRGQLDHFEKWLGICKFPKSFQKSRADGVKNISPDPSVIADTANKETQECEMVSPLTASKGEEKSESSCEEVESSGIKNTNSESANSQTQKDFDGKRSFDESLDELYEPKLKKSKSSDEKRKEAEVIAQSSRDWLARRVDLIIAPYSQYYYALVGWTGSKHFNRDARLYAQKVLSLKLTSHGLFDMKQQTPLPATSEEEVFQHLNIPYRDPTHRNC